MAWWRKILEAQIPDKNVLQEQLEEKEQRAYKKNNAALKTELGSLKVKQSQEKQGLEESIKEATKKFKEYDRKGALFAKEVEQLVTEFYDSTKLIVPRSDFDLRLGAIDSPLLESFLVKPLHKDQVMAHNLLAEEEEVFEERMLKVLTDGNAGGSPFNFLFQQKFNWNNGKLLNASITGDKNDHRGNKQSWTLFMDKTAESLSVERAPEILEFSQNLRIYVEIFIEGNDIKEPEVSFCKKCGADLKNHDKCPKCKAAKGEGNDCCAACGKKNKPDWKFCARCKKVNFPQDVYDVAALNNIRNTPDRQLRLRRELFSVLKDRNMSKQFKADTCLKILAFSLSWSIDDCNKDPSAETVAAVFQCIHDLYMNFKRHLSKHHTVSVLMAHTLDTLGFSPISKSLNVTVNDGSSDEIKGAGYNFLHKVVKAKDGKEVFTKNYIDFQFLHLGENFVREIAPRLEEHKDVKFFPDQWQYDVIQRIKQDKSALVVAPTSTGKTFISFYTITRVLEKTKADAKAKSTDTDMKSRIVFVAPSTPLVNQMGANIYKRYKGENVTFGLFTSEYRENVDNCDILVCTPQILYTLLISPASQAWASRLQYVIFDEIHCIGTQDDDSSLRSSYAKSLAFVPCPFLALSATVQAPAKLQSWLETVTSQEVALLPKAPIQPWNDIQRYQFVPHNEEKSSQLVKMNPIVLADKTERLQYLPHLHLRPEEVHEIWVALKKELGEDKLKSLLKSDEFFAQHGFIKRDDSRKFQQELFRVYIEDLTAEQREHVGKSLLNFSDQEGIETQSTKDVAVQFIELLQLMKHRTLLPTIAFWYEGGFVLDLVEQVAAHLEAMEPKKEYIELPKVEKDKKVVNDKKDPTEEVKMSHKQLAKMWRYHAINAKLQQVREYSLNVTDKCSFLARELFSHEDVIFWMRRLFEKTGWSSRHPLVLALTRGIASYSQALPKPYRDLVETLFRAGALTVIVGTPILSLGLNMPSKTTIFLRNSPGLSALDAVQMEGRAGRRGFDNLGNVVYFYMNKNRIADLIYSPIQELVTPNLIDIDTALNCLILHHQAKDKTLAHDKIAHLKVAPLSSTFTKDAGQQAEIDASRSLRYCTEFLYRLKLVDDKARPIGLAGLATHSIEISPYNYLLAFLIHSGALDNIAATYTMLPSTTMTKEKIASERAAANDNLMAILSYVILPRKITGDTQTKSAPNLPANARAVMDQYNTIVTRVNESVNKAFETLGLAPVDASLSPLIDTCKDGECNGYAVNFYKNKQVKFLVKDNNMSDYDAYATLKQWDSILRKLTAAFKQLAADNVYDPMYTAFAAVTEEFHDAFENISY